MNEMSRIDNSNERNRLVTKTMTTTQRKSYQKQWKKKHRQNRWKILTNIIIEWNNKRIKLLTNEDQNKNDNEKRGRLDKLC